MALSLVIVRPFSQETISVEWIKLETPAGNFVVGPGHVAFVNTLTPGSDITYCTNGGQQTMPAGEEGCLVRGVPGTVTLILR